ncbi:hypothetical protein [Streptomyces sp. NPDC127084]|uniref:hypothetical protein n=1 Tax=Streptomyces sp. NPDC127084 TaxID=3347133 RepID=UPI00364AE31B
MITTLLVAAVRPTGTVPPRAAFPHGGYAVPLEAATLPMAAVLPLTAILPVGNVPPRATIPPKGVGRLPMAAIPHGGYAIPHGGFAVRYATRLCRAPVVVRHPSAPSFLAGRPPDGSLVPDVGGTARRVPGQAA